MNFFNDPSFPYPSRRQVHYARNGMVATSQPLAAQAGLQVLTPPALPSLLLPIAPSEGRLVETISLSLTRLAYGLAGQHPAFIAVLHARGLIAATQMIFAVAAAHRSEESHATALDIYWETIANRGLSLGRLAQQRRWR